MVSAMSSHAAPAAELMAPPPPVPLERPAVPDTVAVPRGSAALDWIAPVRGWQTVAWEAAALAAAAGYGHSATTEGIAYAGAGALVGMTSVRFRGRHLAQWADTQGRYRYRRSSTRRRGEAASQAAEPLATLLPDLGLGEYVAEGTALDRCVERVNRYAGIPRRTLEAYVQLDRADLKSRLPAHYDELYRIQKPLLAGSEFKDSLGRHPSATRERN